MIYNFIPSLNCLRQKATIPPATADNRTDYGTWSAQRHEYDQHLASLPTIPVVPGEWDTDKDYTPWKDFIITCKNCLSNEPIPHKNEDIAVLLQPTEAKEEVSPAIQAIQTLTDRLIAEGPEACRKFLDELMPDFESIPINKPVSLTDADEKEIMMTAFNEVRVLFEQRSWIMEGRGCYPYNDDRYREEIRYLYEEFDSLQREVWKNIKSRSCEYRKKIISEYEDQRKSEVIQIAMEAWEAGRNRGWEEGAEEYQSSGVYDALDKKQYFKEKFNININIDDQGK